MADPQNQPKVFVDAVSKLLVELFDGPPGREAYILNPGDAGLLRQLDTVSARLANERPMPGRTTIAQHAAHVAYGLSLLNRWSDGEANPWADADWDAAWKVQVTNDAEWRAVRDDLRREVSAWQRNASHDRTWDDLAAAGTLASVAHSAYHVGAIRQILAAAGHPGQGG